MSHNVLRLSSLSILALAAAPLAQDLPATLVATSRSSDLHTVLVDRPGDGQTWVLAPGYKARFGSDGADYIPYFGPRASRNFPVAFRVRSIRRGGEELAWRRQVEPSVEAGRIVYDRGVVHEIWDLRLHEVEQSFVLADASGAGDLVIDLAVASELGCEDVAEGLRFPAAGLGEVRYGALTAFDGQGARIEAPARWTGSGIELRVPGSFADRARGALTIDPLISSFSVDGGSDDVIEPDVAYEPTTDRYLVVYERVFSSTDSDIIARRYTPATTLLEEVAVATGSRESHRAAVGAHALASQFLVAWDEDAGISDRVILGRTRSAGSTTQGSTLTIRDSLGTGVTDTNPDVGGSDATAGSTLYCVAYETAGGIGNNPQVTVSLVPTSGRRSSLALSAARRTRRPILR